MASDAMVWFGRPWFTADQCAAPSTVLKTPLMDVAAYRTPEWIGSIARARTSW